MLTMITTITNKKNCRAILKNDPSYGNNHNAHNDHNHHKKNCRAILKKDPSYGNNHNAHNHHKKIADFF